MKSIIALTVAAFTLASCGGGSTSSTVAPTTQDIGILPSGFVATRSGIFIVLTIDGVQVARIIDQFPIGSGFTFYADGDGSALHAETISGGGSVFIVSSPTANLGLAGVQMARLGDTDLPSGGSATFNGGYAGRLVSSTNLAGISIVVGDAQLIADFASASISGDITNRNAGGDAADDILLLPTAITSAGAFSGATTGGDVVGLTTALNGAYVGLIVGAAGNEVVGGLSLMHSSLAGTVFEIGGFVAAE